MRKENCINFPKTMQFNYKTACFWKTYAILWRSERDYAIMLELSEEGTYLITPSSLPTFMKAAIALSSCSRVWPAESWTRILASPFGTTG